jgi:hypothetical protein
MMEQRDIPFSFVKGVVVGENFIGRQQLLRLLRSNVRAQTNTFIVGLPRMGKTSLVKQCFFLEENQKEWLESYQYVPLYISVKTSKNAASFWKSLARQIWSFLYKKGNHYAFLDEFRTLSTAEDLYQTVMMAIESIHDELSLRFVFILDEFDGVRNYAAEDDIFHKIRDLNEYGVVVTCSRRTPNHIEKTTTGTQYFKDSGEKIFVGLFSEEDVKEYWEHFKDCFVGFTKEQFELYKKLVKRYVGNHPMLMSFMNHWLFSQEKASDEYWNPNLPTSQREDIERSLRVSIREVFLRQIEYIKEQGLKKAAIQLVVGTSRAVPEEEIDLLLKYQFIQTVSVQEKASIFGYNLGPTTADLKKRYVCFSNLTTHIMKDLFDPDIKGFELLREVELKLREVITEFLWSLCDDKNPFTEKEVKINQYEKPETREIWEAKLYSRVLYFRSHKKASDDFLNALDLMRRTKELRASYECKPTFDRRLINMVSSTTLGQLWHVFLKWQWEEYFSDVFSRWPNKNKWLDEVFQPVLDWRNAADHHNDDELPDAFIELASIQARDVIKDITRWMGVQG